ncbi:branched-chain amino acid ABC transporter permease [Amycolatopsis sp. A1MSW2902]|uniref:branched-chain amino acid ABC transporter permease n=1 Tax=Amycolatopsis sp. A1MSW2902 TaxID=687413 RepID=UPI00307ED5AB
MDFLGNLINGASLGLIFGVIGMGFVVIYRSTNVISFAHGSLLVFGVYVMAKVQDVTGFGLAVVIGIVSAAVSAGLLHLLFLHPVRLAPPDIAATITIAANVAMAAALTQQIGPDVLSVHAPWASGVVDLGGIRIAVSRLCALAVAAIIIAAVTLANRYTMFGLVSRAVAEDKKTASLMGARIPRVALSAWLLGGAMAAVAGLFITAYPSVGLVAGTSDIALLAFPAVVIGGLDSIGGAVVGGLLVGIAQSLVVDYQHALTFLAGFDTAVPWLVMVVVLLIRPTGLFGKKPLYRI